MKILTQLQQGWRGYHGTLGKVTNMFDSFGEPLFIGDVVLVVNQNEFSRKERYLGNEYGLSFVCEEDVSIVSWTGKSKQYVDGVSSICSNDVFNENSITEHFFEGDYWDKLMEITDGWIITKMKSYETLVDGESIGPFHVQEVDRIGE